MTKVVIHTEGHLGEYTREIIIEDGKEIESFAEIIPALNDFTVWITRALLKTMDK